MTGSEWSLLVAAALVTSTLSGILGIGGGMALLGVMTAVLPAREVVPIHGAVQLVSNLTRTLVFLRHVAWGIFAVYAVPVAVGVACATMLWSGEKLEWFRPGIGVFLLCFLVWRRRAPKLRNPPLWVYAPLGLVVGFLTVFVGATGPFLAPFFLRDDFKKEQVIATEAVCQTWGHVLKIPAFLVLGFDYSSRGPLLGALVAAVIVGTLVGKWVLGKMSQKVFVTLLEILLAGIAVYLIGSTVLRPSG